MYVCLIIIHVNHFMIILCCVYHMNVVNAIRSLCAGKSDGVDDICSDNLKHATYRFIDYIVS